MGMKRMQPLPSEGGDSSMMKRGTKQEEDVRVLEEARGMADGSYE